MRRSNVIALVAPRIEGMLQRPGRRVPDVLSLPDGDLLTALTSAEDANELRAAAAAFDIGAARDDAKRRGLDAICTHEESYPQAFRTLADAPPVLWIRGDRARLGELLDGPSVAIVGSRRASAYGIEVAEELGRSLAAAGVAVISGLALGIDAAAHRGALRAGDPRTMAFLGSGADVVYPRANRRVYDEIVRRGVVVSECAPGRRPFRWTFPARNRLMAAAASMTVVVEAADPSGSLITAEFAETLGKTVGAVPGRVTAANAAGSNRLLREGAAVIRGAADVLDELFGVGGTGRVAAAAPEPELSAGERRVLEAVEAGVDPASMAETTQMPAAAVRIALGALEAAGLVSRTGIGSYERRATVHP